MNRLILLLSLPVLAACATPRESCLQTATRELATVEKLIAETQANLQRGYAIDREPYTSTRVDLCVGGGRYGYRYGGVGLNYCATPQTRYRAKPVAIDRATEQRKLRELNQTRNRLVADTKVKVESCNRQYPPG